jgi:8-oxo-dGTP pyrophosphatase MutT (NUDIX family)
MPSIPTELQVSAGGVAFRRNEQAIEVALISVGKPARWQLPKGLVRKDETTQAAAMREVREETGLETELLELIEQIEYWYYGGDRQGRRVRIHKYVHFFLLRCLGGSLGDHDYEVNEARWCEIGQAVQQLSFEGEKKVVRKAPTMISGLGLS